MQNNFIQTQEEEEHIYGKKVQWQQGKLLGKGTTGEVYEAFDLSTADLFVVKKIRLVHPY